MSTTRSSPCGQRSEAVAPQDRARAWPEDPDRFDEGGAAGRPKYGQVTCCWAQSKEEAKQTAWEIWPNAAVEGAASQELPYPEHFEQVAQVASADDLEGSMPLGPDPQPYLEQIEAFGDAGYTHVYLHSIGFDQRGFLDFAKRELLPNVS